MSTSITWKTVATSSSILSLSLVGDALIYAVLPVHAETFGIRSGLGGCSAVGKSVCTRVRVWTGLRCSVSDTGFADCASLALLAAIVSTALYGLATGAAALLFARILWGLAFAALLLVTLGYAVHDRARVGSRLGWSRAIQHVGPILALVAGAWLTGFLGPRTVFVWLALLTATAIPLALSLPVDRTGDEAPISTRSLGRPTLIDLLFALQGFGVDGVFAVSITLLLAQELPLDLAVVSGASLFAVRHACDAVGAPLFGTSWRSLRRRANSGRVHGLYRGRILRYRIGIDDCRSAPDAVLSKCARSSRTSRRRTADVRNAVRNRRSGAHARVARSGCGRGSARHRRVLLTVVSAELLHGIVGALVAVGMLAWARDQRRRAPGA